MFFALAKDRLDTGSYQFEHELVDIETLNQRAFRADLELTALSLHAYAYLADKYVLCNSGSSMGDKYGPMVVATRPLTLDDAKTLRIAIPGKLTTAYLALQLCLGKQVETIEVPFDQILDAVVAGSWEGTPIGAGLIIHEGQLTYGEQNLHLVVDLGQWWFEETALPLPLGANGVRRDLGPEVMRDVDRLLHASIAYGLQHRDEALSYALQFGRGLDRSDADKFVGMYVNDWTLDFGSRGREAVATLLRKGYEADIIDKLVEPEFVR